MTRSRHYGMALLIICWLSACGTSTSPLSPATSLPKPTQGVPAPTRIPATQVAPTTKTEPPTQLATASPTAPTATPVPVTTPPPSSTPIPAASVPANAPPGAHTDLVIGPDQLDQTISITVGQVIRILPPLDIPEWNVSYTAEQLRMLTPPDQQQAPGSAGWRLQAITAGQSMIILTSRPPVCPGPQPCPPAIARFELTLNVQKP